MVWVQPCGDYQTNCYILKAGDKELIIDPGFEACSWIEKVIKNPVAIINTHGHFDHIWDNQKVKKLFNIPLICHKSDAYMLESDIFGLKMPTSKPDILIERDCVLDIGGAKLEFMHFPGHTEGSMAVIYENRLFSGDFIFRGTIGRVDLPGSDSKKMVDSIKKVLTLKQDYHIYPGHGSLTTLEAERANLLSWIDYLEKEV